MSPSARASLSRLSEGVLNHLPPAFAAQVDSRRPQLASSWGGPMNGQRGRQAMVRQLCFAIPFTCVVETGTYRGTTSEFLADVSGVEVQTVEANKRYYHYAVKRLVGRDVHVTFGDSRAFLMELRDQIPGDQTLFFYLDAHWGSDLPLVEELRIISGTWRKSVILVDDFQVPSDGGYGFDDYGPGLALNEDLVRGAELRGWHLGYPSLPSSGETGARRGAGILIGPEIQASTSELDTVRIATTL